MVGMACEFVRRHFGWKLCVICMLYGTFKEKLKIHHPCKLGFMMFIFLNIFDLLEFLVMSMTLILVIRF